MFNPKGWLEQKSSTIWLLMKSSSFVGTTYLLLLLLKSKEAKHINNSPIISSAILAAGLNVLGQSLFFRPHAEQPPLDIDVEAISKEYNAALASQDFLAAESALQKATKMLDKLATLGATNQTDVNNQLAKMHLTLLFLKRDFSATKDDLMANQLNKIIENNKSDHYSINLRGLMYFHLKNFQNAHKDFNRSLQLWSGQRDIYLLYLFSLAQTTTDLTEKTSLYRSIITHFDTSIIKHKCITYEIFFIFGVASLETRNYEDAFKSLRAASSHIPDNVAYYNDKIMVITQLVKTYDEYKLATSTTGFVDSVKMDAATVKQNKTENEQFIKQLQNELARLQTDGIYLPKCK